MNSVTEVIVINIIVQLVCEKVQFLVLKQA